MVAPTHQCISLGHSPYRRSTQDVVPHEAVKQSLAQSEWSLGDRLAVSKEFSQAGSCRNLAARQPERGLRNFFGALIRK